MNREGNTEWKNKLLTENKTLSKTQDCKPETRHCNNYEGKIRIADVTISKSHSLLE